ncbi:NAD-dependent epimerase/dehydratase family protein [Parvularcula dongshanensis]|uniref:UDP-glucuronate 4-epimerase n=1 Tax=Parvularcula dongshanensis TaxID=1173995 RepID=A0A840I3I5_9PROT|nr:NAD-dependent epimerase/dehydratase family protein [Parvularcula dongshanensis]MBB4658862.1 UDP-glucuronate 4-epimerase [Parvularcula dongshanensis]
MSILVTGAAGFIGAAVCRALLDRGDEVIGLDSLNAYYDPAVKRARLATFEDRAGFRFVKADLAEPGVLAGLPDGIDRVVHLAAQAGVRYSLEDPLAYVRANLTGHAQVLEFARHRQVRHTVYASSSSVYGANEKVPFAEDDRTDDQVSFYGATKKSDELLSQSYARLYRLPLTGLRFFTVYGPEGRPDMAAWIFAEAILKGAPIRLFNEGRMARDFTYIDDVVTGILAALGRETGAHGPVPHRVYNIGNDRPQDLGEMVRLLEQALGRKAQIELAPMQPGDVERTWADITRARTELGYDPVTPLDEGLARFADWFAARTQS